MFIYNGNIKVIEEATARANKLLDDENFYAKIKDKNNFDMATCTPREVSDYIKAIAPLIDINVKTYRRRWSRALAYFTKSRPFDININSAKLNRSFGSIVATLIHEMVHMVDDQVKEHYFSHGDNSRKGKQNTAPYFIGSMSQGIVTGKENYNNEDFSKIVYKRSILSRVKSFFYRLF